MVIVNTKCMHLFKMITKNYRARPSVTINGLVKARYAYQVNLVHPKTKELIGNPHIFRKTNKTPDPKQAAYEFAEVIMSPSIVVESIVRIREPVQNGEM